ncbi:hypothetical protein C2845_PM18G07810 [Panicum miliaceum]|uniref:BZIP domain-containing protein n=1 Tax=Panicum miliaceum TaxID=4540 RepID=A0A3L6PHD3_PANMI|nr:hypothetical protein C2845_PM18G07810 [Panicum miliaceum]
MTDGDVFAQPEAPAATHLPTLLVGGQLREGLEQPSSWTASGLLPASEGACSGFAGQSALLEQIAVWAPQSEMPFVSPQSGIGAGSAQPPSDCELAPLPASLRIPSLEETNTYNMSSTFGESMIPWHCGGSSMDVGSSISTMPDLTTGAMKAPLLPMKQVPIDAATIVIFTDAEKEIIRKDKKLQELMNTDPKKVKRIIADRFSAAKRKAIKDMRIRELERQVEILQGQYNTLSAELPLLQGRCAELETQRNGMGIMMLELERQDSIKTDVCCKKKVLQEIHTLELEHQERCAVLRTQHKEMSMMVQELERQAMLKDGIGELCADA